MSFDCASRCIVVSVQDYVLCSQNERLQFLCDVDICGYDQKIIISYLGMTGHSGLVSQFDVKKSSEH